MNLVAVAIISQLLLSVALPYILSFFYPEIFGKLYIFVQAGIMLVGIIMLFVIINSDMIVEGKIVWIILFLVFPLFGIVV